MKNFKWVQTIQKKTMKIREEKNDEGKIKEKQEEKYQEWRNKLKDKDKKRVQFEKKNQRIAQANLKRKTRWKF